MRRAVPSTLLVSLLLALTAAGPVQAASTALKQAYVIYQTNGKIPACSLPAKTLKSALNSIPGDAAQYSPDFKDAIQAAIDAAAAGACTKKATKSTTSSGQQAAVVPSAPTGGGPAVPAGSPADGRDPAAAPVAPTPTPAAVTSTPQPGAQVDPSPLVSDGAIPAVAATPASSGTDSAPAPLIAIAIMLALLAVLGGVWIAARWFGFDPPWLTGVRHAGQEAGWRASAAWSEFSDWVRLGR